MAKTKKLVIGAVIVAILVVATWLFFTTNKVASPPIKKQTAVSNKEVEKPGNPNEHSFSDTSLARLMVLYNQQASELAAIVEQQAGDTEILALAKNTAVTHQQNTDKYVGLLNKWKESYSNLSDFPQYDGDDTYPTSPGLLRVAQIKAMSALPSEAKEIEFVNLMLLHHEGTLQYIQEIGMKGLQYGEMLSLVNADITHYKNEIKALKNLKTKGSD